MQGRTIWAFVRFLQLTYDRFRSLAREQYVRPERTIQVSEKLLVEEAEKGSYEAVTCLPSTVKDDFDSFLKNITTLIPSITVFFEKILVMAENKAVKENRLACYKE